MRRRMLLLITALPATAIAARPLRAGQPPLRLGADPALVASGLAPALQRAFGLRTGLAAQLVALPMSALLDAAAAGEVDIAFGNAPAREDALESKGLVAHRRRIASGGFLLVGPARSPLAAVARRGPSGDIAAALDRLHAAANAAPGDVRFVSAGDGSGTHLAEQAAWRAAARAPEGSWYTAAAGGADLLVDARTRAAHAIVERGVWAAGARTPLTVLVDDDPRLVEPVHAMQSFRSPHPASRLFLDWLTSAAGRAIVAAQRGYRPSSN